MITLLNYRRLDVRRPAMSVRGNYNGLVVLLFSFFLLSPVLSHAARPQHEIKLATLAPENSSLMKIFRDMNDEMLKETDGRVGFKLFSGFVLGDERDVFRKLRIGAIDAATFTSNFLANINPDIRALQVPFLFSNYREVDYVLETMVHDLHRSFSESGYQLLGLVEIGFIYVMTTVPINSIDDWKGKKVWSTADAAMANAVFRMAEVAPVTVSAPDVLVALQTNLLEVVYNSPYYALVTQWYTRIKYITDVPLGYIGGGLIIGNKAFSRLSSQDQEIARKVCTKYLRRLIDKTRKDNQEALDLMLKKGIQRLTIEPGELNHFKELFDQAMADLDPKFLPKDTVQKVRKALEQYRTSMGEKK